MRCCIRIAFFGVLALGTISGALGQQEKADLLKKAETAFYEDQNFEVAIQAYGEYLQKYPSDPVADEFRLKLGLANLFSGKNQPAIEAMAKLLGSNVTPALKDSALFWTAQAQLFSASGYKPEDPNYKKSFEAAIDNYSKNINDFPASPSREDAIYGRALAEFYLEKFDPAEKDLTTLLSTYGSSPNAPDYQLTLGIVYSARLSKLKPEEQTNTAGQEIAKKALEAYTRVANSQANLIAANDATFKKADLIMGLATKPEDYQTALEGFRQVKTREELVPEQDRKVKETSAAIAAAARAGQKERQESLRKQQQRENGRLKTLQENPDQAVLALVKIGECYVRLGRMDEARLVLRRVEGAAQEEQRKTIRYLRMLTYAAQRKAAKADEEFVAYQKDFPNDPFASNISVLIGDGLAEQKDYQGAYDSYSKSLKDYPTGKFAPVAAMKQASMLVKLGKVNEASAALQDFITKNPTSPNLFEALNAMAEALVQQGKIDEALASFRKIANDPKAGASQASAALQACNVLVKASRWDEAIKEYQAFIAKYPQDPRTPQAMYLIGAAYDKKNDLPSAITAFETVVSKYPKDPYAVNAQLAIASTYAKQQKFPEMVAAYEKFISTFPTNERVPQAYLRIAENQARANDFETAAKTYQKIIDRNEPAYASSALVSRADLWVKAANLLTRNYSALNEADRGKWKKYLESAEADNVQLLQKYADQPASGKALENLVEIVQMRQRADLVKKEELTAYFDGLAKKFSDPSMQARVKLVQAGLPFAEGDYAAALKIFKDVLANQPEVKMSAGDLGRYGTLLLAGNQLDEAAAQFEKLLQDYPYNPQNRANEGALIDGNHGLGVVWMKKNDLAKAETYFSTLKKQYPFYATVLKSGRVPQAWKILEAEYGIGRAWLAAGKGVDATKTFLSVYVSEAERLAETQAEKAAIYKIRALAAFAYAESLEKAGKLLPTDGDDRANAAFNYVIVHDRFGGVNPELAAEGLWRGGQIFQKGNKAKEAREAYTALVKNYPKSPFASKAQEALKSLPAAP